MSKKLLITGASGFLGRVLCDQATRAGFAVHGVGFEHCEKITNAQAHRIDLCDPLAVRQLFALVKPTAVIHAAAMAHPAQCQNNPEQSYRVNVLATRYLADAAARRGAPLVFTSSEQVFAGGALVYAPNDRPNPIHVYGLHKVMAEQLVAVVARLPLMYSTVESDHSFVQAMIRSFKSGQTVKAFADEIRPPAHVLDVAQALVQCVVKLKQNAGLNFLTDRPKLKRILHLGGPQALTRLEMAQQLAHALGLPTSLVHPTLQTEVDTAVPRPSRLWLDSQASWHSLGIVPRTWADSLSALSR